MKSYYDRTDEVHMTRDGTVRKLPYDSEGDIAHYDFRANPSLIPEVLEDFRPFGHQRGVQKFYRLLRYLNGPDSIFETTDCLFRPPAPNPTPKLGCGAPLQVIGRFMLVFRDHTENLSEEPVQALHASFHEVLADIRPGWKMGCIGTATYWAWFTSLSPEPSEAVTGREFVLRFWAWGHDENECFDNFGTLMQGVGVALCRIQTGFEDWVAQGRPSLRLEN